MLINSQTVLLGLLGSPVKHSLSPLIHNSIFRQKAMNAAYLCFEVQPESFKAAVKGLQCLGVKGFNLTVPYKEKVLPLLDGISEEVKLIGSANTIMNKNGRLIGYNTDGAGFIDSLKLNKHFFPAGKKVSILGAGGAAKAIAFYLCREKVAAISIYDIKRDRALGLSRRLGRLFKKTQIVVPDEPEEIPPDTSLLVNATGIGMHKTDPALFKSGFLRQYPGLLVYDLTYNPAQPALLQEAEKAGLAVMNGLWMLVYQALRALTIWFESEDFLQKGDFCYNLLQEAEAGKT